MAFTATMLSWATLENGRLMGSELASAREAIRWATDYLLKCATASPGKLYVQVGNPYVDHSCWQRPEDMSSNRPVYSVSASNPGSDVAGETAAAMAAASMVFRRSDPKYAGVLLQTAAKLMQFALNYRGAYSQSLSSIVCPFYCSYSGYKDELMWGAAWLYTATKKVSYLNVINSLGANDATDIFSWDNKFAGARVLLARNALVRKDKNCMQFIQPAEDFMCHILPNSPSSSTQYTPGGLMYKIDGSNLQYVTAISFLLTTYGKYMNVAKKPSIKCGSSSIASQALTSLAKRQIDYILGDNPLKISFMVGYGRRYPLRIHHRGASNPSMMAHAQAIGCQDSFSYLHTGNPNPNIFEGAIVGGPTRSDQYDDNRENYGQSEPTTYINAAAVGSLAYFAGKY
ncbi:endoglucanase 9-like [Malania oleifera]|uniref:endoglucanase 9-like n=1 Tax=Malania oleifera TaxID=397392 RepID=UPI0025AE4087|nr:endoglucanase 9-like [Malania oleifera]